MTRRPRAPGSVGLFLVAILALLAALWRTGPGDVVTDAVEARLLDLRFRLRGAEPAPGEAVIVALDEAALQEAPGTAARRSLLAAALTRIGEAASAAVAMDLLLLEETAADSALAKALAGLPNLVLAAAAVEGAAAAPLSPETAVALERSLVPVVLSDPAAPAPAEIGLTALPRPAFALTARIGHVHLVESRDRVARSFPPVLAMSGGRWLPAMPVAAAAIAQGGTLAFERGRALGAGERRFPLDRGDRMIINHLGPAGTVRSVPLVDVAEGRAPPGLFAGRMVFIGSTAESLGDLFATPFGSRVSGVEILATIAVRMARGETIERTGAASALTVGLCVVAALAAALLAALRSRIAAIGGISGVVVLAAAALQAAFAGAGLWLDATSVLLAVAAGSAIGGVAGMRAERRLSDSLERERSHLARYVAPILAESLAERPIPSFDRRRQQAAILFVDVAGYTAMTEAADPVDVAQFLRALHGYFESVTERHGGIVADYMGDGALIVFGLPEPQADDRLNALIAAGELADAEAAPPGPGEARVILRVSLHAGEVAAAVLGGQHRGHVSVTGDTVNVAARLQDLAKARGVPLILSAAVADEAGRAGLTLRALGETALRGRREPIALFARMQDSERARPV